MTDEADGGMTDRLIGPDGTEYPLAGVAQVIYVAPEPDYAVPGVVPQVPQDEHVPVPWTAYALMAYVAGLTAVGVFGFGSALSKIHPALAVFINVVAVGGAAPTVWPWRHVAVRRWIVYGVTAGVGLGWMALVVTSL